ncbi:hypothetical protein ACIQPS_35895 [Streptomyces sp. NPDC091290]|uniref:hypothetical protein n=1 Tax=Streptomyces sp. NPDC091290 TaxID=3365990 RepID=UPI00381BC54B
MSVSATPASSPAFGALVRHFADLRDGVHGDGASTRQSKERLFLRAVELLAPHARQALEELNTELLLSSGEVAGGEAQHTENGSLLAQWSLSWPEQRDANLPPVSLQAYYGIDFHHPHLRGATVGEWPLNVFTPEQASAELATLRAVAAADLHNLVFARSFRIVPVTTAGI